MRIVCAPDSFKESMTATQAAEAMAHGIHQADPSVVAGPHNLALASRNTAAIISRSGRCPARTSHGQATYDRAPTVVGSSSQPPLGEGRAGGTCREPVAVTDVMARS